MGLFRRRGSKANLAEGALEATPAPSLPPPPPTPHKDILLAPNTVVCTVLETWQWLLEVALKDTIDFTIVGDLTALPTASRGDTTNDAGPPAATPSRRRRKKTPTACPLRIEVKSEQGLLLRAFHGSSEAFDGLEDKDELFRTLQRCRCDHLELSPPSRLINWDVTRDECHNVVGDEMPVLGGTRNTGEIVAVLKEPMGSRGTGIFFVRSAEEIHEIINEHKKQAMSKPNFLDDLIASKGRIPCWGKSMIRYWSPVIEESHALTSTSYLLQCSKLRLGHAF